MELTIPVYNEIFQGSINYLIPMVEEDSKELDNKEEEDPEEGPKKT